MKTILVILASFILFSCTAQVSDNFTIETSDIPNFWKAYDSIQNSAEKAKVFSELYLDKASEPFKKMIALSGDIRNPENYLSSFEEYPKFWNSLRNPTLELQNIESEIIECFSRVKELYPNFKPGDVCIFIGVRSIQASVPNNGNLIFMGGELNLQFDKIDLSEFKPGETFPYQNSIKSTIVHETIHLQQKGDVETLLGQAIHEGSADFLAELFLNEPYKSQAYIYGRKNEEKLWIEFAKEMDSADISNWFYIESGKKDRPADLGYFIGYMISQSYYEKAMDKNKAIQEIIEVTDFEKFLETSGYADKFGG
ncbi:DUF2268 domain-containing putative Zn-dependent protease [Zobellia uliginosa]|uniref:gliding motility protein GldB-related protein n=1 Tax=Zobellia uliginosa TaxID=143224 RepID=UPI001C067804|nr:DUF2268 domain-containing putative Zn-dependent protease [Zobellia uliginosa]MBU2947040.1 DUF2268 domain-containing protein [Zobellia uliginosa]